MSTVDLRFTYGAVFIGQLVNSLLTGLEIVQLWLYCWNYWSKDNKALKFFIAILLVIDIMSSILGVYALYWYLVLNYGNVPRLEYRVWAKSIQTILYALPCTFVQLYYARRVYVVSGSIICPAIVVPVIIGGSIVGIYLTVEAAVLKLDHRVNIPYWLECLWFGANVFTDVLITATMSWSIYRKKTGFAKTDSMIMTLMVYTINTGFLLTALGAGMTISFIVAPSTLIWVSFALVMSKCYVNALLSMLNTRDYVRQRYESSTNKDNAYNLSSIRIGAQGDTFEHEFESQFRQPGIAVTIHRSSTEVNIAAL